MDWNMLANKMQAKGVELCTFNSAEVTALHSGSAPSPGPGLWLWPCPWPWPWPWPWPLALAFGPGSGRLAVWPSGRLAVWPGCQPVGRYNRHTML